MFAHSYRLACAQEAGDHLRIHQGEHGERARVDARSELTTFPQDRKRRARVKLAASQKP